MNINVYALGVNSTPLNESYAYSKSVSTGNDTTSRSYTQASTNASYALSISNSKGSSNISSESQAVSGIFGTDISYASSKATGVGLAYTTAYTYTTRYISFAQSSSMVINNNAGYKSQKLETKSLADNKTFVNRGIVSNITNTNKTENTNSTYTQNHNSSSNVSSSNDTIEIRITSYNDYPFSYFNYGNSSIERYCIQKIQSYDINNNISRRAHYWMEYIATNIEGERNVTVYESKYNITKLNCINMLNVNK